MSLVHLHLMLNHIPVVGAFFLVVMFATGLVRGNATILRMALWTCGALGAIALLTFFTGEPAEEAVEHLVGTSEAAIERHESVALIGTVLLGVGAALSLATLAVVRRRPALPRWIGGIGLAGSLIVAGAMVVTANLGGQIRHSELRGDAAGATAGASEATRGGGDDDDR